MWRNRINQLARLLGQHATTHAEVAASAAGPSTVHGQLLQQSATLLAAVGLRGSRLSLRPFAASAGSEGCSEPSSTSSLQQSKGLPVLPAAVGIGGNGQGEVDPLPSDADAVLAAWGRAMDEGDWETAWDIFEQAYPVDTDAFPSLEELQEWDPEGEERAERRQRELDKQAEQAARWVRKVDEKGRAHAAGKRKTSVARVWLREGAGHIMVNKRPFDLYFPALIRRNDLIAPFEVTGSLGAYDVMVNVRGGGVTGQAQAVRHGIARALQQFDTELRPALKAAGLLTRDDRMVERKKVGRKKARKAFQWVKR